MPMQLFIDTNVFLNFYHHTGDDIGTVAQLLEHMGEGAIVLHMPQQVADEFVRNRENKLRATAAEFSKDSFPELIPRHMNDMEMASAFKQAVIAAKKARSDLIAEATAKALTGSLEVDKALNTLFANATKYAHSDEVLAKGKSRADRGNPPGKVGSYGDQYNWETLLHELPSEDLYVVSRDGDYASTLGGKDDNGMARPNTFLKHEWAQRKPNSNLYIFDSIKAALAHYTRVIAVGEAPAGHLGHGVEGPVENGVVEEAAAREPVAVVDQPADVEVARPDIDQAPPDQPHAPADSALTQEQRERKSEAIGALVTSGNFASTHAAISDLLQYERFFTKADVDRLAEAVNENQQISWIIGDKDVNEFYLRLLQNHIADLDPVNADNLTELLDLLPDQPEEAGLHG